MRESLGLQSIGGLDATVLGSGGNPLAGTSRPYSWDYTHHAGCTCCHSCSVSSIIPVGTLEPVNFQLLLA